MRGMIRTAALGVLTAFALSGAAQASEINVTVRVGDGHRLGAVLDDDRPSRPGRVWHGPVADDDRPARPGRTWHAPVADDDRPARPGRAWHGPVADDDDDGRERGLERRHGRSWEGRDPGRYYGRPVPEFPHWTRPVRARPGWGFHDECRVIVKHRLNRWGDLVERRVRICR